MVHRFAAHYLLVSPSETLPFGCVSVDGEGRALDVFSLQQLQYEPCNTRFFDGVIAPFFINAELLDTECLVQSLKKIGGDFPAICVGQPCLLFNYFVNADGLIEVAQIS